ncbi:MAG: HPP family protein, partial [Microgenomates group bacterium]
FFILTKVHYLPVFDDKDNFIGIISARRVLNYLKSLPVFDIKVADFIKRKKIPIFIYPNTTVPEALATFKKTKISKLIVVDNDGRLKGVLSYYDLIDFLVSPVGREERGDRQGFKKHLLSKPVSDFYKSFVLTITKEDNLNKAINLILDKKIGSVIVVDEKRKPLNIITTSDLLRHYLNESKAGFFKNIASGLKAILPRR